MFYQIASAVAAPLAKTGEIVILSGEGSRVTGELNRLLAELPVSVNALTGVDLTKVRHCSISSDLLSPVAALRLSYDYAGKCQRLFFFNNKKE